MESFLFEILLDTKYKKKNYKENTYIYWNTRKHMETMHNVIFIYFYIQCKAVFVVALVLLVDPVTDDALSLSNLEITEPEQSPQNSLYFSQPFSPLQWDKASNPLFIL